MAGNKESSWRRAAVLGPSPSAFAAAGVRGWERERGALVPWDTEAQSGRGTASPLFSPLDTSSPPRSCSVDRESQEKGHAGSDSTGKGTEKQSQR